MKNIKYLSLVLLGVFGLAISCADDKELVPVWESAVHGFGTITSSATDFKRGDNSVVLDFDLQWISIDGKASVTKIDVYVLFDENYTDNDGNPAVANHGGDDGRLLLTLEGGNVPANRTNTSFSLSQTDVFNLYNGITFDYKDGVDGNAIDVFATPFAPGRNTANRFIDKDKFTVRWELTTADGRVFSAWSPSVCTEFPGANCQIEFGVVCATTPPNPGADGGQWVLDLNDSYGDGWNGAFITVTIDGTGTDYGMLVGSSIQHVISVPSSATSLDFSFTGGSWDSEITFTITSPRGNVVANVGPSPADGPITLNLCND